MADKKSDRKMPFRDAIPEEARTHAKAARQAWRKSVEGLLPADFLQNRRIARKEMLLAVRSVIDAALDHFDTPEA